MERHTHRCGVIVLGKIPDYGCGFEWSHATVDDWRIEDHYCPKCGCGPFTFQTNTRERINVRSDELIEKLKEAQTRHGSPLPVVALTAGGSGEVDAVEVVYDSVLHRYELHLAERP